MPPKRKRVDNEDDDDGDKTWKPPPSYKEKPKNSGLLAARNKMFKGKAKIEIRCECGQRCADRTQLKNHRKTHPS